MIPRLLGFDLPIVGSAPLTRREGGPDVDELSEATDETEPDTRVEPAGSDTAATASAIESLLKKGFRRLYVNGRVVSFDEVDPVSLAGRSVLQVVVDRVQLGTEDPRQRRCYTHSRLAL